MMCWCPTARSSGCTRRSTKETGGAADERAERLCERAPARPAHP
jgi:hypothetical protein